MAVCKGAWWRVYISVTCRCGSSRQLWDWVSASGTGWETRQEEKQRTDMHIPNAPETHGTELRMQETE